MRVEVEQMIKDLNDDALYKISMSSIELFHSNFWDWMFTKYKESILYFFEGIVDFDNVSDLKSRRERKHLDISIEDDQCFYVIENKVKSLPDQKQLDRYSHQTINKKPFGVGVIASLIKMDCFYDNLNSNKWIHIDYKHIAERIKRFAAHYKAQNQTFDAFDFDLIDRYQKMITKINDIMHYELTNNIQYQLDTALANIGFASVYRKIIGSILKNKFRNHNEFMKYRPYFAGEGVYDDINRSKLTLTIQLKAHEAGVDLGIQIEEYEYRRFVKKSHKLKQDIRNREHKREIACDFFDEQKARFGKWFVEDQFYRYVTEDYTFVYQRQECIQPNTTYESIIQRVIEDINTMHNEGYLSKEDVIEKAL